MMSELKNNGSVMTFRRLCTWIFALLLLACALTIRVSIMTSGVRILLAGTLLFGAFTGMVHLIKLSGLHPRALYPAVFFIVLFVVWAVLADRPPNVLSLRSTYVKRLQKFEGTRYVWGGETTGGIDCSGLARSSLWQAMLVEGGREFNPELLGIKFWKFWWRDAGVSGILHGKYGYTKVIGYSPKLAGYDTSKIKPGDMAVASMESHVMIYLGNGKWIEANPKDGNVVINKARSDTKRHYFNTPVTFVRWKLLQERQQP
ncbi:MAG: C40 family peptidase [Armatimonadota bacterium]